MRIAGLARELGCSTDYLRRLERDGRIPAFPRDALDHRRIPDTPEAIEVYRQALKALPKASRETSAA